MDEKKLFQEINELKQEIGELKKKKTGAGSWIGNSFKKGNVLLGLVVTILFSSVLLFAAQNIFTDGELIIADDVNANFKELYDRVQSLEAVSAIADDVNANFKEVNDRVQALEAVGAGAGKIVNVTVHESDVRTPLSGGNSIMMEDFNLDKKSSTSILLIQGTISGYSNNSGSMQQGWQYGISSEVLGQSLMYEATSNSRIYSTTAVISGHGTTGLQRLTFRYYAENDASGNRPFSVYNPNKDDDARLGQTKSVYTIWEIEP
ncbi:MAG: hypothetical protein GY754_38950 [bacterium]|nr:hypothetical protein [bacterium]